MKRFYIYKLFFESGATYIGQHTQTSLKDNYITSSGYFRNHPEDKLLKREIILDNLPDKETMNIMETICICSDKAENIKNVNGNLGGWLSQNFPGWNLGVSHSNEQKQKISKALKGRAPWNKGKTLSEDHKIKISNSCKGKPCPTKGKLHSEETKKKMSESQKKVVHTKEWNKKVGDAQKGKPKSKEAIEKMRQKLIGRKMSEEDKRKIRDAQLGSSYWNNGIICKRFKAGEEPGEGWVRGRLDHAWNAKNK